MRLLPLLIALYALNFLDRSNLAQAREGTLERDLGMSGTDFNLATSIFFVRVQSDALRGRELTKATDWLFSHAASEQHAYNKSETLVVSCDCCDDLGSSFDL